jgi:hypothetical protein
MYCALAWFLLLSLCLGFFTSLHLPLPQPASSSHHPQLSQRRRALTTQGRWRRASHLDSTMRKLPNWTPESWILWHHTPPGSHELLSAPRNDSHISNSCIKLDHKLSIDSFLSSLSTSLSLLLRLSKVFEVGTDRGDVGQQFGLGKVFFLQCVRGGERVHKHGAVHSGQTNDTWRLNEWKKKLLFLPIKTDWRGRTKNGLDNSGTIHIQVLVVNWTNINVYVMVHIYLKYIF